MLFFVTKCRLIKVPPSMQGLLWQGFALVAFGAFLTAIFQIINKHLVNTKKLNAPPDCVAALNSIGSGILLLLLAFAFFPPHIESWFAWNVEFSSASAFPYIKFWSNGPVGLLWPLMTTSLLNIVILFGNVRALKLEDASLVGPISAAQPMMVIIPSMLILNEVPGFYGYLGLLILALGTYGLGIGEIMNKKDPITGEKKIWQPPRTLRWLGNKARFVAPVMMLGENRGVQIAFLVAACGAVSINFDKLSTVLSSTQFAPALFAPGFILVFCGLVGIIKVLRTKEIELLNSKHVRLMFLNVLIYTALIICYWTAFHFGFAAYIGALKRLSIPFLMIFSYFLLGEMQVKKRWPGAVVMAVGAALLSL